MNHSESSQNQSLYWRKSIILVCSLLSIWFVVSLGAGILFRDWLDLNFPKVGTAPFGFWMAQQGSIIVFVLLLIVYKVMMDGLESREILKSKNSK